MDRKVAIRLIRWAKKNKDDPYLDIKIFFRMSDGNIPIIAKKPLLEEYGIPYNY